MRRRDPKTVLSVQALDDRIVPAVIDLTTPGASAAVAGGLVNQVTDPGSWWRDDSPSFVRLKHDGTERGYNTNARPLQFHELRSHRVTRAITLGQVPRREVDGAPYREFLLDVKEPHGRRTLSVDEVKLFLGDVGNLAGYANGQLAGLDPVYDLDAGGDVSVLVTGRLHRRFHSDDMQLLVPEAAFAGATADTFVYLYSKMGGLAGARANGRFEEWGIKRDGGGGPIDPPPPPPPPADLSTLSGAVYVDFDQSGGLTPDDVGVEGATLVLEGTDDEGNPVSRTAVTDIDGRFTFADLRPGTYSLRQVQPLNYMSAAPAEVGDGFTVDGTSDPLDLDHVFGIRVGSGQDGAGYNFQETELVE
jgi:hypothetical protein